MYAMSINIHALYFKILKGIGIIFNSIKVKHLHWIAFEEFFDVKVNYTNAMNSCLCNTSCIAAFFQETSTLY